MNLKAACKTAMALAVISIALISIGHGLLVIPAIARHLSLTSIINAAIGTLGYLLPIVGFLVFLLAFATRFKNSPADVKTPFVVAGILILLGTLMITTNHLKLATPLYESLELFRFAFYMVLYGLFFLSGLCMSLFIFRQSASISSTKAFAATTLGVILFYCVLFLINSIVYQPWNHGNTIYTIGWAMMILGSLVQQAAILLFLFAFLKQRP